MTRPLRNGLSPVVLLALAAGCDTGQPGAGLTNGPPPTTSEDKPAMRTDLPTAVTPDAGEPLGGLDASTTNAGTGGRGGGDVTARPEAPAAGDDTSVRARPPRIDADSPNTAAGATKPADNIKTGTPKGPQ